MRKSMNVEEMFINKIILGPMAGVTDLPFRVLCKEQGADLMVTEMVSAKGLFYGSPKTEILLQTCPEEKPVGLQLFGSDPDIMAGEAAKLMEGGEYDIDLTVLDSTLCYAQVFDMVNYPENYTGKSVRMRGNMAYFSDEKTGGEYFAVIIPDAAGCCAQGIEFKLAGDYKYPDDYPELGTVITVTGSFDSYEELGNKYIELVDAKMTVG